MRVSSVDASVLHGLDRGPRAVKIAFTGTYTVSFRARAGTWHALLSVFASIRRMSYPKNVDLDQYPEH